MRPARRTRVTLRCVREDLGVELPPVEVDLGRLDHPLVAEARRVAPAAPRGQKRILSIEHPLVYRIRHARWRGATWLETEERRFWLCAGALREEGSGDDAYLRDELGPHGAFLAKVADGPVAFACTLQQDGLPTKIRDDVAKIVGSGSAVAMVYVFTAGPVAVGRRHELQRQIGEDHTVALEILDSFALAELLADPELFWIAVQYLRLPVELAPARESGAADQLAAWYVADRDRWRARGRANPAIGELLDLRDGLRYASDNDAARADFPFWLGLMIELTDDEAPGAVRQRARYEVGVAQLQGGRDLSPADGHVAAFLDEAVASDDPVLLGDAVVLLTFAIVAFTYRRTALGREQLTRWHQTVLARARELLDADPAPTARARLLELIGRACFIPDPARVAQAAQPLELPDARELVDEDGRPRAPMARKTSDDLIDVRQGLDAWIELAKALPDTPLFPVDMVAGMLEILASSLVDEPEWRELTDAVGAAVARAEGGAAAAERSHRRSAALLEADRTVDTIGEIHRARMEWWSGDHLRPTVMTSLCSWATATSASSSLRPPSSSRWEP